ncbi:PAS domain S-box [Bernardetia litoralis DSM 6794]|uniref:histidine kinase n=1 Tax=Bernardetia litoralis (strain ATCC 23117 / DSM 6794 / NBRC 15988 / NCIMB 1366 / Fx l1 / Sio-4) TaxID=880071 RepID=I4AI20_BERLS|nr:PAS domain-containing protein [Bernardetia litoralis]AFM03605.1 PAS domain S-box [Bernardetia litoralis DSM 6794]
MMNYLKQEFYQILKSDETFFDFIQMNAFDGIWFWSLKEINHKWINPKFCSLLGYEYEELQGNQIQKIVHPKDQAKMQAIFDTYIKNTESVYEDEIRFIHKEGNIVWLKLKALVFDKKENKSPRVLVTHTNITKQYNQKETLKHTLDRYESILNNYSTFIIRVDMEGNYSYVNNSFCERLQLKREEIIGTNSLTGIAQEDIQQCIDAANECLANPAKSIFAHLKKPVFDREKNQYSTTEFIYTDWEYRAILDNQKNITEIQCIGFEVTEKVLAEKELEHTKNLLQTCNEAVMTGTWQIDLINKKITWDKVTKQIHEVEEDYQSDMSQGFKFQFYTPEYKKITKKLVEKAVQEGIPFDEELQIQTEKRNKKWVRAIGIPVMENNLCIEVYGTFQDITVHKKAELQLQAKANELEASEEELRLNIEQLEKAQYEIIHTKKILETCNESTRVGVWILDLKTQLITVDKIIKDIHEVEEDFVYNTKNGISFYKEGYDQEIITKVFTKALEEGVPYDEQLKLITAKGNEIWVRAIGIPTFENGKCVELYGTFQNIDKQKRNEINLQKKVEELKISKKQLISTTKLLETCNASATIGTWNYDIHTRDIIWDTIIHSIYELPLGIEIDTQTKINFFKERENRNKAIQIVKEARKEGKPFDEELEIINFRGNKKWIRIIGIPQMKNGQCSELYGTLQDISAQKNTELQLKEKVTELEQAQKEIQKIQSKLSTTLEKTGIGLWEFDITTNQRYWDKQTRKMLGLSEYDKVDENSTSKIIHKDDLEQVNQMIADLINQKITEYKTTYKTIPIDGKTYYHESKATLIKDNEGNPILILGVLQDITKQKNAKLQLKEKITELKKAKQEIQKIQSKLSMTLEKTGVGLWELCLATNETKWDEQCYKLFHENKESFTPNKWQEKIYPQDLDLIVQEIDLITKNPSALFNLEYRMMQKTDIHYYHSKGVLIEEDNNQILIGTVQDITKQKNAKLQLKEKVIELETAKQEIQKIQSKLSLTLEKTGIGLWEFDIKTQLFTWDKQTQRIFGIDVQNPISRPTVRSRVHTEDVEEITTCLELMIKGELKNYEIKYRTVLIEEKHRFLDTKAFLIKDKDNNPAQVVGITQDVTKQKEYEKIIEGQNKKLVSSKKILIKGLKNQRILQKNLAQQKQQLEQIFDAVPAMIYQFKRDKDGNISFPLVSKGAKSILGIETNQLSVDNSVDIFNAVHPEDLLGFQSSVQKSADTMQKWESELRLLKKGREVWIHATSKPTYMDDGGIIWTGIMQNIDHIKETELQIQEQNKELQNTLNELRETQSQLIHNEKMTTLGQLMASIAHEINTPLGAIRSSAGTVFKLLNNTLTNLPRIVKIFSEEDFNKFNELIEKAIKNNILLSSREKRAVKYKLIADLEEKEITQVDRIADLIVDAGITKEYEAYKYFLDLDNKVEIFESIYEISTILKSNATVRIATEKASKIIITLKNFSRQDHTGKKQLANINENLQNTLVLYQNKLKYGIEVIREMDNLPMINVYEDELVQVWTNLLHNAIQAIKKKGKIYLTTTKKENKVLVSVKDTGSGIPDEVQTRIFDAFFTTKPTGEGSGLGLSIVRKIIEKHDGKIWFETQNTGENTGTTFFVELPIQ